MLAVLMRTNLSKVNLAEPMGVGGARGLCFIDPDFLAE